MIIADIAIHLGPRATQMFNISNIIMNQVPDADGNIIPASVQSGSAKLMGSLAIHRHILVAMEASSYNVSKATCWVYCLTCDGYSATWIEVAVFGVAVNGQTQENFDGTWDDEYEDDLTPDANQNQWTSGNTGLFTVANTGVVSGVSPGSTWIDAFNPNEPIYVNYDCSEEYSMCPEVIGVSATGSGTTQVPTSATIESNTKTTYSNQTQVSCDGQESQPNAYGYQRCITYQVEDQNGNDLEQTLTIHENITTIDTNLTGTTFTGDNSTNSAGQFLDQVALVTTPNPVRSDACTIVKQTFTATGNSSPIRVNCIQQSATDETITDVTSNPGQCSQPTYTCH